MNRHSTRYSGYDYAQPGAYFVTICTHTHVSLFGEIADDAMCLNEYGEIVSTCWQAIPNHFPFSKLDVFMIMPNHIHAILWIIDRGQYCGGNDDLGRGDALSCEPILSNIHSNASRKSPSGGSKGTTPSSLGAMIQNFKSVTTRNINRVRQMSATPVWQRNYYEHIIRNEAALHRIREYTISNPIRWALDEENPSHARI